MCNSLTTQYLFQTPDYRLFSIMEGYLSGCVSGISPILERGQRVLVDQVIIPKTSPYNCMEISPLSTNKPYILGAMITVPLEEF